MRSACPTPANPAPSPSDAAVRPAARQGRLGARAGHPSVRTVCALAPWLEGADPVRQLAGRTVLLAHGDQDRVTDPERSYAYALRARQVSDQVCRFDVPGDGHAMLRRRRDWRFIPRPPRRGPT